MSFAIGAFVFLTSILVTVFTTQEDPPADMEAFLKEKEESRGIGAGAGEILGFIREMPPVMAKLGAVQFFSWFAFFTMWSFATRPPSPSSCLAPRSPDPALRPEGYGVVEPLGAGFILFNEAANAVSSAMGVYGLSSMVFALGAVRVDVRRGINRRMTHLVSLVLGGIGFLSMSWWTPETAGNLTWVLP